ncbi:ABC transporter ATP-binding protein [Streptomyces sp. NBC_00893]|uniref:ABC transporter ATP-binding protein n=1 Tax=Streptomyces sp. NBC_00893 TaxID=2975862 RepID=UPI00225083F6|nr:ABC transporter ATP-binding protein [Streptomyces sp. NBC_00893]MCX4849509.1 ABC transporter ATP-binding protein/permease [Streptomyces sp. NBC_00893]
MRAHALAVTAYAVLQGTAFALLVPVLRALLNGDEAGAARWFGVLAAVTAATCVAYYVQAKQGFTTAVSSTGVLYRRFGDRLGRLSVGWFSKARLGSLTRLATAGVGEINTLFAHALQPLITSVVSPLTVLVVMLFLDWRLGVAMVAAIPLLFLTYRWSTAAVARTDEVVDEAIARANSRIFEFARSQSVIRAFGRAQKENDWLDEAMAEQHDIGRRRLRRTTVARGAFGVTVQLSVTVLIAFSTMLALRGTVDAAQLIALAVLLVRFSEPVVALSEAGGALRMVRHRLDQMDELFRTPSLPEPAQPRSPADAGVELSGVRFRYPGDAGSASAPLVLDGLDVTIPPRSMTALVGPSGSGKTTVTRLIARLWDVDEGVVRIGGVDVRQISGSELTSNVAMVFQDVYLFEGTIADNVRIGRPDAPDEDVAEAARLARVDEIVERLPDGWNTAVGEGGTALSGGERQRVSLARAIVKQAPVLILDEATSALDPVNEMAISDTVRALTGRCTLLVIAHRLPTVVAADRILVLDRGRIAESGTHEELRAGEGIYRRFWEERSRVEGWRFRPAAATGPR